MYAILNNLKTHFLLYCETLITVYYIIFRSARSLAGSGTPPIRTYMRAAKSGPSAMELDSGSSSEDESAHVSSKKSATQPRPIPRSVSLEPALMFQKLKISNFCSVFLV